MAKTYQLMAELGVWDGFYRGPVATAMARAAKTPPVGPSSDHVWRPGLMTRTDIKRYRPIERKPTVSDYRNYRVYGMPPPSSGGTTVGEALNILEQLPGYRAGSALDKLYYYLEASRYAYADRNAYIGDPGFVRVPVSGLLSDAFATERAALIGPEAANRTVDPGYPWDDEQRATGPGQIALDRRNSTTHLTVVDDEGMVASYTFTIESTGGNGIVVPGWGFLLNNELTDFNYDDVKHPNAPQAGKRPRSSMAPTYVERNGRPFLALGSPGGATIITTVLQNLIYRLDLGNALPAAIAAPRASQRNAATTQVEPAFATAYSALTGPPHLARFGTPVAGGRRRARRAGGGRVPAWWPADRRHGAGPPRRRQRGGGQRVAQSLSTGSKARAPSTTASASASASALNGPVATAATRTRSARAHAMSRGVSPITIVRSRAHRRRAGARGRAARRAARRRSRRRPGRSGSSRPGRPRRACGARSARDCR